MVSSLPEHAEDAALVASVQQGEPAAFAELFRRHWPDVRRLCARRMGSVVEGDEVAQAAFVRAFERIEQCSGDRRFGAWVSVIAVRLCADAGRSRSRLVLGEVSEERLPRLSGPEDAVVRLEGAGQVRDALRGLPARQREVVIARDIEGRGPAEIAAALGVTIGAVDSLLLRARRRLAAVLANGGEAGATDVSMAAASTVTSGFLAGSGAGFRSFVDALRRLSLHAAQALGLVPGFPGPTADAFAAAGLAAAVALGGAAIDAPRPKAEGDLVAQVSRLVPPAHVPPHPVAAPPVEVAPPSVVVPPAPAAPSPVAAPSIDPAPMLPLSPDVDARIDRTVTPVAQEILDTPASILGDVQIRLAPVGD